MPLSDGSLTFDGNTSALMNDTKRDRLGYNSTRNPGIDVVVVQAPYKEMLPCLDLCIDIVRSCPANLGFACPNSPAKELRCCCKAECSGRGWYAECAGMGCRVGGIGGCCKLVALMNESRMELHCDGV
jgi:hypothetical protein